MTLATRARWEKAIGVLLILTAAALPVLLYDYVLHREGGTRSAPNRPPTPTEIVDAYHHLFYDSSTTWQENRWLGIKAWQNPNDVWIIQEIISEVDPDFVVEAGTALGGSALIWAMLLEQMGPDGRVITIDIKNWVDQQAMPPIWKRRVVHLIGSSTAPEIVAEVRRRVNGRRAIVILDSDHSMQHVLAELEAYAPLVEVGSYLIVQDSAVNGHPVRPGFGPGPMEAIEEFLRRRDDFVSERGRERLLFTMHPKGYLRRVK